MRDFRLRHPLALLLTCAALLPVEALSGAPDRSETRVQARGGPVSGSLGDKQVQAARLMERSLASIAAHRRSKGLRIDPALDPTGTGIIGDEFTPLTTSLGDVKAKRTGTNPAFAAVVVKYFGEAGLRRGDVVAVGASGSFPAFLLASLCAARALELEPLIIYSIGASMFGANVPGFTFVEMVDGLRADGLLPYGLLAVSPGGRDDLGTGVLFDEDGKSDALVAEAKRSGLPVIEARSLAASIEKRLQVYEAAAAGRPIRLFVNVGGAAPNYVGTPASLDLPNGLVLRARNGPSGATRGLVFE
ncbi:MAG: poly-gamma-glutamate system protein, partial [Acidobacteria bacterium]